MKVPEPKKPTHSHLIDEARDAARAYQTLCAHLRIGKSPSEALFKRLEKARKAINRWNGFEDE